jgi:Mg-chelatase subunit ChlD/ppGpp synthetase/RelA/SpoT-type nucleotidyltranferase
MLLIFMPKLSEINLIKKKPWEKNSYKKKVRVRSYVERVISKVSNTGFILRHPRFTKKMRSEVGSYSKRRKDLLLLKNSLIKHFNSVESQNYFNSQNFSSKLSFFNVFSRVKTFESLHNKINARRDFILNPTKLKKHFADFFKKFVEQSIEITGLSRERIIKKFGYINDSLINDRNVTVKFNSSERELLIPLIKNITLFESTGMRFMVENSKDCRTLSTVIKNHLENLGYEIVKEIDFIESPRKSESDSGKRGYRSIHLLFSPEKESMQGTEIQIRSWDMQHEIDWLDKKRLKEAAQIFEDFLLDTGQQEQAIQFGFRPADPSIPLGFPLDANHGVDKNQPQTVLEVPNADVTIAIQDLWSQVKKPVDVVVVMDISGSMRGKKISSARESLGEFIGLLDDRDRLQVILFSTEIISLADLSPLSENREELQRRVSAVSEGGGTRLFDATLNAYQAIEATGDKDHIRALVVLSDGMDTESNIGLDMLINKIGASGEDSGTAIKIFTIAFGNDANKEILRQISESTGGRLFIGDPESIYNIYAEIETFF